jgi:hypothetical protein
MDLVAAETRAAIVAPAIEQTRHADVPEHHTQAHAPPAPHQLRNSDRGVAQSVDLIDLRREPQIARQARQLPSGSVADAPGAGAKVPLPVQAVRVRACVEALRRRTLRRIEHAAVELETPVGAVVLRQKQRHDLGIGVDVEAVGQHEAIARENIELAVDGTRIAHDHAPNGRVTEDVERTELAAFRRQRHTGRRLNLARGRAAVAVDAVAVVALLRGLADTVAATALTDGTVRGAGATRLIAGASTDALAATVTARLAAHTRLAVGDAEIALLAELEEGVAAHGSSRAGKDKAAGQRHEEAITHHGGSLSTAATQGRSGRCRTPCRPRRRPNRARRTVRADRYVRFHSVSAYRCIW